MKTETRKRPANQENRMKRFTCSVILLSAAALCGNAASASTSSPGTGSPSPAKTSAFAGTSWSPAVKAILAEYKAARGGAAWDHIHSLRTKGTIEVGGLSGSWTMLDNLRTGSWIGHAKIGPIEVASGFDGQTGWNKAPNGEVSADHTPDAKKSTVTSSYSTERAWWYPERSPASIKLLGKQQTDGKTFDVLKITPKGGKPFKLWISAKTHLVARNVSRSQTGTATTYLSDYRTVHGIKIPFHRLTIVGKQRRRITRQIKSVAVNVPVSASDFAMPTQNEKTATIIGGGNSVTIPFKALGNLICIRVKVNGHPFNFIVDSGGGDALRPQAAKAIGIEGQGALKAGGYGSKTVKAGFSKIKSLVLDGKVSFRNQLFAVIPLPGGVTRQSVAGTVGYSLFMHFVVQIDYAHKKLTLTPPANFDASNAGTRIPITFFGPIPAVKGSIDGLPGLFLIDTGTNPAMVLTSPFARKHDLYARYQTTPAFVTGGGYRGKMSIRVARGGQLKLGGVTVHNPVMILSAATNKGAASRKAFAGIVGGAALKRFTATFDYANNAMYLKPNQNFGKPMNFTRSGVLAKPGKNGFVVTGVIKGSPGAQAGIKAGDVITAINGTPASKLNLLTIGKRARNDPPGTKVKLTIGQGHHSHTVTITLRRLIPKTGGLEPESSSAGS